MEINEKEFAVIREISNNHMPTQRHIAKNAGISLGLTNLIIKRLIKKGYIKIQEAPARTVIYTLTPQGLSEKIRKSYEFTLSTINLMSGIKSAIQDIIINEYKHGVRNFVICGYGEISAFTEIALRELNLEDIVISKSEDKDDNNKLICNLIVHDNQGKRTIDMILELSKRGIYR
ncbi:MAG: winged helix-turn-helix transcriptional regulator [Candidatus Omnitrophica bacterium]|nr:winged helix-turn-helix transcriptional regulator [Candidatus Omnitrophota bacterium]MBU1870171.1 winged helix-turn-helix transcriptional regulator [Candidatus Omnitrophota bacterium]